MIKVYTRGWKLSRILVAAVLVVASLTPLLTTKKAEAYGLVTNRSIQMSSSAAGAGSVSYLVSFRVATDATDFKGIVVDFCSNTPVLGDTCSGTVGTDVPNLTTSPTVTTTGAGVGNIGSGWTADDLNSGRTLTLTNTSAFNPAAATDYFFTITGVTNPSDVAGANTVGSFFARIYTFQNDATSNHPGGYTPTNLATNIPIDAGGVALSTAAEITVTAKVAERLVFCVYTLGDGNDCGEGGGSNVKSGTSVALGDTNGVLSPLGPYVSAYNSTPNPDQGTRFSITTNASFGATVRLKGTTLTSGGNTISACTNQATCGSTPGTEQFGLCLYQAAGSGLAVDTFYDGDSAGNTSTACSGSSNTAGTGSTGGDNSAAYTFDDSGTGTTSTYGDDLGVKTAGDYSTANISFLGNIGNATQAGIYTTTLTFIATGVY
jgi:hypothetical protein